MRYRVNAQNEEGTQGESPVFDVESPEEAEVAYRAAGGTFPIVSIEPTP